MKLEFVKISPTENMTVLVKTPVPRDQYLAVGAQLIKYSSVYAEQAGFIEKPVNSSAVVALRMMAGEFCGNGAMALGAYIAFKRGLAVGEGMNIPLEVSGAEGIRSCYIEACEDCYRGTVDMPLPIAIDCCTLNIGSKAYEAGAVTLEGIRHFVLPKESIGDDFKERIEGSLEELKSSISEDAFGIIVFDETAMQIYPLVVVKSAGSIYWERGCGSGSEAVGVYLADKYKRSIKCELKQPGGVIMTEVVYDKKIIGVSITGYVKIAAEGIAYI